LKWRIFNTIASRENHSLEVQASETHIFQENEAYIWRAWLLTNLEIVADTATVHEKI